MCSSCLCVDLQVAVACVWLPVEQTKASLLTIADARLGSGLVCAQPDVGQVLIVRRPVQGL